MTFEISGRRCDTATGESTHYFDVGEGAALVMIHGSGPGASAQANWHLALPALSGEFRVVAPDLLGFGQTTYPPGTPLGIRAWGRQIMAVLDRAGLRSAWLIGNSLGGWIALQLALDHPDRVAGIVSMGTGGAARASSVSRDAASGETPIREVLSKFVWDKSLITDDVVESRLRSLRDAGGMQRFTEAIEARDRDRVELPLDLDALGRLGKPLLLVHGRDDAVIPVARSWELAHRIPQADLHVFAQCGHWTQIERADEFHTLIREFVRGTPNRHGKEKSL